MSTAANLVKLLPSNTVLAFQALSPSFSNRGQCHIANVYLTMFLITISAVSCCFFSLTDSLMGPNGKLYYGIATRKGLYIFNCESHEENGWMISG
ncbi:hypothetical protein QJS10_CPA16g01428 [Acorus calamus]|uniref:Uncharacterized protein n=1 Tax=Acorus calamus TaxID=4465 RepID=A0AAV9D5Q0_ACOCL|nr:hypothetical protein QJS10_CPA16g01428 [Acorus calamus]